MSFSMSTRLAIPNIIVFLFAISIPIILGQVCYVHFLDWTQLSSFVYKRFRFFLYSSATVFSAYLWAFRRYVLEVIMLAYLSFEVFFGHGRVSRVGPTPRSSYFREKLVSKTVINFRRQIGHMF